MLAHAYNKRAYKTESKKLSWVQGQSEIPSNYEAKTARLCLRAGAIAQRIRTGRLEIKFPKIYIKSQAWSHAHMQAQHWEWEGRGHKDPSCLLTTTLALSLVRLYLKRLRKSDKAGYPRSSYGFHRYVGMYILIDTQAFIHMQTYIHKHTVSKKVQ